MPQQPKIKTDYWKKTISREGKLRSSLAHISRVSDQNLSFLDKEKSNAINGIHRKQRQFVKDLESLHFGKLTVPVSQLSGINDDDTTSRHMSVIPRRMSVPVTPSDIKKRLAELSKEQECSRDDDNVSVCSDASTVGSWGDLHGHDTPRLPDVVKSDTNKGSKQDEHSHVKFHPGDVSKFDSKPVKPVSDEQSAAKPVEEEILNNIRRIYITNGTGSPGARRASTPLPAGTARPRRFSLPDALAIKQMHAARRPSVKSLKASAITTPTVEEEEENANIPKQRPNTPVCGPHREHHAKCFQDVPPSERPICTPAAEQLRRQKMYRAKTSCRSRTALLDLNISGNGIMNSRPQTSLGNSAYRMPNLIPDERKNQEILQTLRKVSMTPTLTKSDEKKTLLYLSKVDQDRQNHVIMSKIDNFLNRSERNKSQDNIQEDNVNGTNEDESEKMRRTQQDEGKRAHESESLNLKLVHNT